jgi:hypothetical protein
MTHRSVLSFSCFAWSVLDSADIKTDCLLPRAFLLVDDIEVQGSNDNVDSELAVRKVLQRGQKEIRKCVLPIIGEFEKDFKEEETNSEDAQGSTKPREGDDNATEGVRRAS